MNDFEPDLTNNIQDYGELYNNKKENAKITELQEIINEKENEINYLKGRIEDLEEIIKRGSFQTADTENLSIDEIGLFNIMQNQTYVLERLL